MSQTQVQPEFIAGALVPIGGIIMWSGSVATIPSSWALCNGTNGTPNLQDRFLIGAGSGYAVGATGGSANATLVSHSHTATSTATDSGHTHNWGYEDGEIGGGLRGGSSATFYSRSRNVNTGYANVTVATTISPEGASATNANLPPYYALAFIMRVS
jgi:microcystin-dependent protein